VSHSYVFETARKDVPRRVRVPVRLKPAGGTGVFTDPQRLLRQNTTRRALFRRTARIHGDEVRSLSLALVLEQREERPPCCRRGVAAVRRRLHHPLHVQVFDRHEVVLPSVVVREFMEKITALPSEIGVTLCDATPLLLVVVRPVLLPREFPLLTLQAFTLVGEIERLDRRAVGVVGVLENPHVNSDALLGIFGGFGRFTVDLDAERGEPLARRLLLDRDLLEVGVVGDVAVESHRNVREFRE